MSEVTADFNIQNFIEGPLHKIGVRLPKDEYIDRAGNGVTKDTMLWTYNQILPQLSPGILQTAWASAQRESEVRVEKNIPLFAKSRTQIPSSLDYAFRTFKRRSDGNPIKGDPRTALCQLPRELHEFGKDSTGAANMIYPGILWYQWTLPVGLEVQRGIDTVEVLVYKNEPFIVPSIDDDLSVRLITLNNTKNYGDMRTIPILQAKADGLPTLRDLLLRQVEININ